MKILKLLKSMKHNIKSDKIKKWNFWFCDFGMWIFFGDPKFIKWIMPNPLQFFCVEGGFIKWMFFSGYQHCVKKVVAYKMFWIVLVHPNLKIIKWKPTISWIWWVHITAVVSIKWHRGSHFIGEQNIHFIGGQLRGIWCICFAPARQWRWGLTLTLLMVPWSLQPRMAMLKFTGSAWNRLNGCMGWKKLELLPVRCEACVTSQNTKWRSYGFDGIVSLFRKFLVWQWQYYGFELSRRLGAARAEFETLSRVWNPSVLLPKSEQIRICEACEISKFLFSTCSVSNQLGPEMSPTPPPVVWCHHASLQILKGRLQTLNPEEPSFHHVGSSPEFPFSHARNTLQFLTLHRTVWDWARTLVAHLHGCQIQNY